MIPIALMEKFTSQNFVTCIEVSHMTRHSSKSNTLRNLNTVRGRTGKVPVQKKRNLTMSKSKSSRLSYILDEANKFEIDKCNPKMGLRYQKH